MILSIMVPFDVSCRVAYPSLSHVSVGVRELVLTGPKGRFFYMQTSKRRASCGLYDWPWLHFWRL